MKTTIKLDTDFYCAFVHHDDDLSTMTAPMFSEELRAMLKRELGVAVLTHWDLEPDPPKVTA